MTSQLRQRQPVIMQIIPELSAGGAEQGCIDVAAEIVRAGAQAIVVSNGGDRVHELERAGAIHVKMPVHSKNPLIMWNNVRRLRKVIDQYGVHIVHARSRAPAWSAYAACSNKPTHYMSTCHAPYNISGRLKRFYNSAIAKGERIIAISNYVSHYLQENYNASHACIRVIHRGIALDRFHPTAVTPERMITLSNKWRVPDGSNIILLPGRLTRWKGHHVLIQAMARLRRKDLFCVIIGSDQGRNEYRKELEETIEEKGLGGQIRIVDHCEDMPAAYMLSSVAISASTDPEGFGRVPVEAQAMGRPIVATSHGGAQETVLHGQTGWLTPPGDAIALADAIEQVMNLNANQRAILATRAMSHVAEHFTVGHMTDQTLDVYAELLRDEKFQEPPNEHKNQMPYKAREAAE